MLTTVLVGVLTAIRDVLVAAALAWVGVSIESVEHRAQTERACTDDACQQQLQ